MGRAGRLAHHRTAGGPGLHRGGLRLPGHGLRCLRRRSRRGSRRPGRPLALRRGLSLAPACLGRPGTRREPIARPRTVLGVRLRPAIRPASSGDSAEAAAFGRLFDRHAQAVYAFCARRTADLSLAEDLTSATFLEAWRHRGRVLLDDAERALPWLLGVANNVVRNARRGQRRQRAAYERLPLPPAVDAAEEHAVTRSVAEARLRSALAAIGALSEAEQ